MAGCGSETGDRTVEALGSELLHVDAITVHYGDGNRLSVTDPVEIQEIVSLLKENNAEKINGDGRRICISVGVDGGRDDSSICERWDGERNGLRDGP
ncbi:hypothetical protein DOE73_27470 [Paenibacillus dendritiformis]|nr:hypothetical protein DOE73_27470 [Paenibacillus dendritiformis]